jgi:hypothetical protein
MLQYWLQRRHKLLGTKLHPPISSIGYNIGHPQLYTFLQDHLRHLLKLFDLVHGLGRDELVRVEDTCGIDEGGAEKSIIPIENNCCFLVLRLLGRSEPNLLISQSREELSPHLISALKTSEVLEIRFEGVLAGTS